MAFPSDQLLYELFKLDTDGVNGFRAILNKHGKAPLPPDHLRGPRWESFEKGVDIGRRYFGMRRAAGIARRESRNAEYRREGIKTVLSDNQSQREEKMRFLQLLSAEAAYHDPKQPPRNCDACGMSYTGPAVYCSITCTTGDA